MFVNAVLIYVPAVTFQVNRDWFLSLGHSAHSLSLLSSLLFWNAVFKMGIFRVAIFRNAVFRKEVFGLRFLEFAFHRQCRQGNLWGRHSIIIDWSSDYLLIS